MEIFNYFLESLLSSLVVVLEQVSEISFLEVATNPILFCSVAK